MYQNVREKSIIIPPSHCSFLSQSEPRMLSRPNSKPPNVNISPPLVSFPSNQIPPLFINSAHANSADDGAYKRSMFAIRGNTLVHLH